MTLTRAFKSLAKKADITQVELHELRHLYASVMIQQKESPAVVSKRLGHASVATTFDIYSHVFPGWQKDTGRAFGKVMHER